MQTIMNFFDGHPARVVELTLALNALWSAFVGSLAAPTATSSAKYVFFFKFINTLAFNFHRAASTSIENSPNFLPAVEKYIADNGLRVPLVPPQQ